MRGRMIAAVARIGRSTSIRRLWISGRPVASCYQGGSVMNRNSRR
jgi:hypothetical protein